MLRSRLRQELDRQARPQTPCMRIPPSLLLIWVVLVAAGVAACSAGPEESSGMDVVVAQPAGKRVSTMESSVGLSQIALVAAPADEVNLPLVISPGTGPTGTAGQSRGYLTTPQELKVIADKAEQGIEPYASAYKDVIAQADRKWDYNLDKKEKCRSSDAPKWNDDNEGTPRLYARALAYQLTGDARYAAEVHEILEKIMTEVLTIDIDDQQCRLNFGWGVPELVASADLIEDYWSGKSCQGPVSTEFTNTTIGSGKCKVLFQNWLAKNPYYIVSLSAAESNSNWGAAATNTTAYIADYLWDRPEVTLIHRQSPKVDNGAEMEFTPSEAYAYANQRMLNRMNGYSVDYHGSNSCDFLAGGQQSDEWAPVKSQITENGIVPEDARREEEGGYCNVPEYAKGVYQNYPQIHLGNNIQQCELMLRRGDRSCFDNIDNILRQNFAFVGPDGETKLTTLYPGRGSIERAINAVIIDAEVEWKHDAALEIAYRYYYDHHRFPGFDQWFAHLDSRPVGCSQHACFTTLTHGFAANETPTLPPTVSPP